MAPIQKAVNAAATDGKKVELGATPYLMKGALMLSESAIYGAGSQAATASASGGAPVPPGGPW